MQQMRILGIESSCDETSAAVIEDGKRLISVVTATSLDLHAKYGGVIPEIAARSHIESIMPVIEQALAEAAKVTADNSTKKDDNIWDNIDAIAVTYGAGLGGCLLVGVMTARTLAITKNKPLYAINHVEAHAYVNFLTEATPDLQHSYNLPNQAPVFPALALIVSGGHSQLVLFNDHFDYVLLGQTVDDAIGEAFDKVAKVLGLPYPGGPSISKIAKKGKPHAYDFPKANLNTSNPKLESLRHAITSSNSHKNINYDFSFSGPKTAVLRTVQKMCGKDHSFPSFKLAELLNDTQKADVAASFQRIAIETVVDKTVLAYQEFKPKTVIIGGGVASSPELRRQLSEKLPIPIQYTDPKLCTDNGAMVATLGYFKHIRKQPSSDPYSLDIQPNLSM